jgi:hypothetical protein
LDGSGAHEPDPQPYLLRAQKAGVRRVIHLSAIGVDRQTPSAFSRSKAATISSSGGGLLSAFRRSLGPRHLLVDDRQALDWHVAGTNLFGWPLGFGNLVQYRSPYECR